MFKIMVLMDNINFRLLRVTDLYVHETIRIMILSHLDAKQNLVKQPAAAMQDKLFC